MNSDPIAVLAAKYESDEITLDQYTSAVGAILAATNGGGRNAKRVTTPTVVTTAVEVNTGADVDEFGLFPVIKIKNGYPRTGLVLRDVAAAKTLISQLQKAIKSVA